MSHFVSVCQESADWYDEIQQCVLLPGGRGRSCMKRKETPMKLYKCAVCGRCKPAEDFSESAVHHYADKSRRCVCNNCSREKKEERFWCVVGKHSVPAAEISGSDSHHSSDQDRNIICKNHARPACTNPTCTVCSTCRQPHRRSSKPCTRLLEPLHGKQRPQHADELVHWLCEVCRPRLCSNWPRCTKENRSKKAAPDQTGYTCGECLTVEFNKADHRKHFSKK